jgi:hypothetical protein
MKMKNKLGKICIFCLFFLTGLFADIKLTVNSPAIYEGDIASFTITSDSDGSIEFPVINTIDSYNIINRSSSQSTTIINGTYSKKISVTYNFAPTKDVVIPAFDIKVDGKVFRTEAQKISVLKQSASKEGEDFVIQIKADKNEVKVGESINLDVLFKYKLDSKIDKLQIGEPKLNNFWIKKVGDIEKSSEQDYIVFTQKYLLFPQKSGEYDLSSLEADIGKASKQKIANDFFNDSFFNDKFFDSVTNRVTWQKIYSNDLHISVKLLPNNLELFGNYTLNTSVDKTQVEANQPVNLTIDISGVGNIDDIQKFNLSIDNVVSYADEPKIESTFEEKEYKGTFSQKIAFVSQKDYTIPKISLTYFDKETNEVKTIYSKQIDIKVINSNENIQDIKIETATKIAKPSEDTNISETKENKNNSYIILALVLLFIILALIFFLRNRKKDIKVEKDIIKLIKKAKNDKELFELLLPYSKKNDFVEDILKKLEENLYKNTNNKINKKELMNVFEDEIV